MKFFLKAYWVVVILYGWETGAFAQSDTQNVQTRLSANDILQSVREAQSHQREQKLYGQLRTDAGQIYPFILFARGGQIRYQFQPPAPTLTIKVQLSEDSSEVNAASYNKKIFNTDLAYADVALKFIYWPKSRIVGEETIKTLSCWKIQLEAPSKSSNYADVILWVDKKNGSLMRAEAYNSNRELVKRFEVLSGQKIEGRWYLKQMRIESFDPKAQRVLSRTYLEIKNVLK